MDCLLHQSISKTDYSEGKQIFRLKKKLTLKEWLKSVKEGRRGDILCVYLLSMATGTHTAVHLSNNRVWSILEVMPTSHDNLM